MSEPLNFVGNVGLGRVPRHLENHELLHRELDRLVIEFEGVIDDDDERTVSVREAIYANVGHLKAILGLPGARGLAHILCEIMIDYAREGLPLDAGELSEGDAVAFMALLGDLRDLTETLGMILQNDGQPVPPEHTVGDHERAFNQAVVMMKGMAEGVTVPYDDPSPN